MLHEDMHNSRDKRASAHKKYLVTSIPQSRCHLSRCPNVPMSRRIYISFFYRVFIFLFVGIILVCYLPFVFVFYLHNFRSRSQMPGIGTQ